MANTVKVFFSAKAVVPSSGGHELLDIGSLNDPTSITLSADEYQRDRIDVPTGTVESLFNPGGAYRTYYIPSVDGYFLWRGGTDADNSCIFCPANTPFWLPVQTTNYNATHTSRIADAPVSITGVYFYQTSGSTGYVDVLAVS